MENAAATRMHNAASLQSRFVDPTHMNGIFYVYVSLLFYFDMRRAPQYNKRWKNIHIRGVDEHFGF